MSINTLLFGTDKKYSNTFRRGAAAMIDVWITLFLRAFVAQIIGSLWLNNKMIEFLTDFKNEFGTETPKNVPEHLNFILHHQIFYYMLIFYSLIIAIGMIYHSYLNSSAWHGTIGKRMMKIMILRKNDLPITFGRGLLHYILSTLPFVFLFYLLSYQIHYEINLYQAISSSNFNIFLSIVFVMWVQIQIFTKTKVTAYDMIANTVVINGKSGARWPWSKSSS
ncbi:MAG: RDD family protein [Proteobacteria bacterium]|nr:RDD family protein [Pseudomonadota bacterium]